MSDIIRVIQRNRELEKALEEIREIGEKDQCPVCDNGITLSEIAEEALADNATTESSWTQTEELAKLGRWVQENCPKTCMDYLKAQRTSEETLRQDSDKLSDISDKTDNGECECGQYHNVFEHKKNMCRCGKPIKKEE